MTTTPNLEDTIRSLASRGEISHISLVPSQDGKKWRGSFAMCSKFGISFAEDADPIKALSLACTTAKMRSRPAERRPASIELEAVTVAEVPAPSPADESVEDLM